VVKVYVLMDIEGVAGVVHGQEGSPGNPEYERARRLMTGEASAVVAGIFDADPDASVTVVDSHGPYRNIIPEELDERATLLRGKPRHFGMMDGIDEGYDLAMFVGVHGSAGAGSSVLSHTFTGHLFDVKVNDVSHGELGLNASMAGAFGVPVVLVAGDQVVAHDAHELLGEHVAFVQTKHSRSQAAAEGVHPNVARRLLAEAARRVVQERPPVEPLIVETPVTVDVTFDRPVFADLAGMLDDVERVDGRSVRFVRDDMPGAYRVMRVITVLCSTPV
jgi:D-amino peptidase